MCANNSSSARHKALTGSSASANLFTGRIINSSKNERNTMRVYGCYNKERYTYFAVRLRHGQDRVIKQMTNIFRKWKWMNNNLISIMFLRIYFAQFVETYQNKTCVAMMQCYMLCMWHIVSHENRLWVRGNVSRKREIKLLAFSWIEATRVI